ncbi:helix-turn-helix domain-containing protein [Pseudomonas sp. Q1-7]|uniref:helix-turn-helix domain-containing protein n=1 Tax=Pseudomonas sp. Q1-7 TaxID=3020843 RepID=UPI0023016A94|nr:helix-turn-helix domain-containing protein [Pseudomonas sp. Q1-7]
MQPTFDTAKVRQLRQRRFWTQDDLAAISGLSVRTIQRIESTGVCSTESKMALASAFDLTPSDLIAASTPAGQGYWVGLCVFVPNSMEALAFYVNGFGAEVLQHWPSVEPSRPASVDIRVGNGVFRVISVNPRVETTPRHGWANSPRRLGGVSTLFSVLVDDLHGVMSRAIQLGASQRLGDPLTHQSEDGMALGILVDPFGYIWALHGSID